MKVTKKKEFQKINDYLHGGDISVYASTLLATELQTFIFL